MAIQTQFSTPEIMVSTASTLVLTVYSAGSSSVTITPATYTVYDSGGVSKQTGSCTIASNVLSISLDATVFTAVQENCRVAWTFTISGTIYTYSNLFDVVKTLLVNPVIDTDLKERHPKLADFLWSEQTNFQTQIDDAFEQVRLDIKKRGNRANLIIDAEQVRRLVVIKAFEIIFYDFSTSTDDIWYSRFEKEKEEYKTEFNGTDFVYDANQDGVIDTSGKLGTVRFTR